MFIQIVLLSYYSVGDKGKKANFRRASKKFTIVGENLMYKSTRLVIKYSKEIQLIIKDIHEGIGDDSKANAMASHRGRDTTYQKIAERFFWHNVFDDVSSFVKHCEYTFLVLSSYKFSPSFHQKRISDLNSSSKHMFMLEISV